MSDHRSVRLGPPSPPQLRGLRQSFVRLAELPPAQLREWLGACPVCVVGDVRRNAADAVVERLAALDLRIELFSWEEYTPAYLRHALPPPPTDWDSAETSIELVYRPAFEPEAIIRLWRTGRRARMHIASPAQSVWAHHFNPPPWLRESNSLVDELQPSRELPCDEVADVAPIDDLLALALALPGDETSAVSRWDERRDRWETAVVDGKSAVVDGTGIQLAIRDGERQRSSDYGSPTADRQPEVLEFLRRVHTLARSHLIESRSLSRLGELRGAIGDSE